MHPNSKKRTKTLVQGPMRWIGCVRCEKFWRDFVAWTFALVRSWMFTTRCNHKVRGQGYGTYWRKFPLRPWDKWHFLLWPWKVQTPFFSPIFILHPLYGPAVRSLVKSQLSGCEKTKIPLTPSEATAPLPRRCDLHYYVNLLYCTWI